MTITRGDSRVLEFDFIRCVACFAVILMHSGGAYFSHEPHESLAWKISAFSFCLTRMAVPLFVMISGYFLLSVSFTKDNLTRFYQKRSKTLLIPTVFWSLFYLAIGLLFFSPSLLEYAKAWLLNGKMGRGGHMWYLYMILGLYAVAPFLATIFHSFSRRQILAATLALTLLNIVNIAAFRCLIDDRSIQPITVFTLYGTYIPYFFWGKLLGDFALQRKNSRLTFTGLTVYVAATLGIFFAYFYCPKDSFWVGPNYETPLISMTISPLMIIQAFSFYIFALSWSSNPILKLRRIILFLAPLTFGMYLVHVFFIYFCKLLLEKLDFPLDPSRPFLTLIIYLTPLYLLTFLATYTLSKIPYLRRIV